MKKPVLKKKLDGFTLTELMVVLVIIGILTLIALPRFMDNAVEAYRTEVKLHFNSIKGSMNRYRMEHFNYPQSLEDMRHRLPEGLKYDYYIRSADKSTFILEAKAKEDFDGDGDLDIITLDEKGNFNIEQED